MYVMQHDSDMNSFSLLLSKISMSMDRCDIDVNDNDDFVDTHVCDIETTITTLFRN